MRVLSAAQVAAKLGKSEWWVWNNAGKDEGFPKPFKLSANSTVWDEADLDAWLLMKKEQSHGSQGEERVERAAVQPACSGS